MQKQSLRKQCLTLRERVRPDEAKTASLDLAKHLLSLIPENASVVAGYKAVRGEIDLDETMAQLSTRGHTLALPVVVGLHQPLVFRQWRIGHPLELGQFGIKVPPQSEPELTPDAVIVPLVAFDKAGYRLGYGAGYYDLTLRQLREAQKKVQIIGAAFSAQQVESIPAEAHDEKLDAVVTEKEIIRFSR